MVFDFDEFELDEPMFELRRGGQRVDIQPKALALLIYLVKNRLRCVSNDELLAALWPSEKVGRTSLPKAVYGARRALDGSRSCHGAIRTVRGRGYRFALPVRERDGDAIEARFAGELHTYESVSAPEVHIADGIAYSIRGDVFVAVWSKPATRPRVTWLFDAADRFAGHAPGGILALIVVLPSSSPPNHSTAIEILRRQARLRQAVRRQANVAPGSRLWLTLVKNALRAMHVNVNLRLGRITISSTIEDGIARVLEEASRATPSAADLRAEVQAVVDALNAPAAPRARPFPTQCED